MEQVLAPYLPMDRRQALATGRSLPTRTRGAALFADLSGFTPLTEALRHALGPRRGAEEVARQVNAIYDALLPQVHRYGGSVIAFAGDGMICYFDQDDGSCATACALAMQAAMRAFQHLTLDIGEPFSLGLKVGIATGPVRRFLVGDPGIQRLEALMGQVALHMIAAEKHAQQGEVLVAEACATGLDERLEVAGWRGKGQARYAHVAGVRAAVSPRPWPALAPGCLPEEVLRPWLLPVVYERLCGGQGEFLTELRPVVALFVRFSGIDYDEDEAGTELDTFVCRAQHLANEYEGTLVDLTLGDKGCCLYLAFGAPVAHEDDALRALRVAQALRACPYELRFIETVQIGISQGLMRVGAYGGAARRTYGVLGDEVNLAARLMQAAVPGQVLVSGRVQSAVGERAQWEALSPLQVKGKREPVPSFALGATEAPSFLAPHTRHDERPLVGRQAELNHITGRLSQVLLGQGQIVELHGVAGIGKSRLVAVVARVAEARGLMAYGGACASYGTNSAYLIWQPIWRALLGLGEGRDPAILAAALARLDPTLLPRLPLLAEVVGLPIPDNDLTHSFDAALRKQSREALLVDILKCHARRAPTLLVLEDAHWLDPLSHDLLEVIGRAIRDLPVLILLVTRPTELLRLQAARVSTLPHYSQVILRELDSQEAERLIRTRLRAQGKDAAPIELVTRVLARAQGNPFYLEELVAYLVGQGMTLADEHEMAALDLPPTLESLLLSHLDQLREEEKFLLKLASILGRAFRAAWLWGYYPTVGTPHQVRARLKALSQSDLLLLESPEPELAYLFKHVLTQEVTYGSLAHALRSRLHEQVARYLEATLEPGRALDLLAYHYERGTTPAKAREYLLRAGEAAQRAYANEAAEDYYHRLLPLLTEPDEQMDLHLRLAAVLDLVGRWEAAEQCYQAALSLAKTHGNQVVQARSTQGLGKLYQQRGQYEAARTWLEAACAQWEALGEQAGISQTRAELGVTAMRQGDYEVARRYFEASLQGCLAQADRAGQAYALSLLGHLTQGQGAYGDAQALYEESLALRRTLGDRRGIAALLNSLGMVVQGQGHYEHARALYEESLALRREMGDRWAIAVSLHYLGTIAYAQSAYDSAQTLHEESLALLGDLGDRLGVALSLNKLGFVAHAQGKHEAARCFHRDGLFLAHQIGARWLLPYHLLGLAMVWVAGGRVKGASLLAAAEALRTEIGRAWEQQEQALYDSTLALLLKTGNEEMFTIAWREGQALTLDETVQRALADESSR